MSRDQVIAAIYETAIQPHLYDAFIDAWDEYIQLAIHDPRLQSDPVANQDGRDTLGLDLIRLAAFLINADTHRKPVSPGSGDEALPYEMLTMSTGLEMQVFQAGPANGRPVIFLHGMLDGMSPLQVAQQHFKTRGLRVLAPTRSDYGQSDPVTKPSEALDLFTAHVDELITKFKLQRPIILGYLAGAIYGYHLCSELGTRLGGWWLPGPWHR